MENEGGCNRRGGEKGDVEAKGIYPRKVEGTNVKAARGGGDGAEETRFCPPNKLSQH